MNRLGTGKPRLLPNPLLEPDAPGEEMDQKKIIDMPVEFIEDIGSFLDSIGFVGELAPEATLADLASLAKQAWGDKSGQEATIVGMQSQPQHWRHTGSGRPPTFRSVWKDFSSAFSSKTKSERMGDTPAHAVTPENRAVNLARLRAAIAGNEKIRIGAPENADLKKRMDVIFRRAAGSDLATELVVRLLGRPDVTDEGLRLNGSVVQFDMVDDITPARAELLNALLDSEAFKIDPKYPEYDWARIGLAVRAADRLNDTGRELFAQIIRACHDGRYDLHPILNGVRHPLSEFTGTGRDTQARLFNHINRITRLGLKRQIDFVRLMLDPEHFQTTRINEKEMGIWREFFKSNPLSFYIPVNYKLRVKVHLAAMKMTLREASMWGAFLSRDIWRRSDYLFSLVGPDERKMFKLDAYGFRHRIGHIAKTGTDEQVKGAIQVLKGNSMTSIKTLLRSDESLQAIGGAESGTEQMLYLRALQSIDRENAGIPRFTPEIVKCIKEVAQRDNPVENPFEFELAQELMSNFRSPDDLPAAFGYIHEVALRKNPVEVELVRDFIVAHPYNSIRVLYDARLCGYWKELAQEGKEAERALYLSVVKGLSMHPHWFAPHVKEYLAKYAAAGGNNNGLFRVFQTCQELPAERIEQWLQPQNVAANAEALGTLFGGEKRSMVQEHLTRPILEDGIPTPEQAAIIRQAMDLMEERMGVETGRNEKTKKMVTLGYALWKADGFRQPQGIPPEFILPLYSTQPDQNAWGLYGKLVSNKKVRDSRDARRAIRWYLEDHQPSKLGNFNKLIEISTPGKMVANLKRLPVLEELDPEMDISQVSDQEGFERGARESIERFGRKYLPAELIPIFVDRAEAMQADQSLAALVSMHANYKNYGAAQNLVELGMAAMVAGDFEAVKYPFDKKYKTLHYLSSKQKREIDKAAKELDFLPPELKEAWRTPLRIESTPQAVALDARQRRDQLLQSLESLRFHLKLHNEEHAPKSVEAHLAFLPSDQPRIQADIVKAKPGSDEFIRLKQIQKMVRSLERLEETDSHVLLENPKSLQPVLRDLQQSTHSLLTRFHGIPKEQVESMQVMADIRALESMLLHEAPPLEITKIIAYDSSDPTHLLLAGREPQNSGSCQRYDGSPSLMIGLLGYWLNAHSHILRAENQEGVVVGRAMLKVVEMDQAPALLLERMYYMDNSADFSVGRAIKDLAVLKAQGMGVPLVYTAADATKSKTANITKPAGLSPYEYSDTLGGVIRGRERKTLAVEVT